MRCMISAAIFVLAVFVAYGQDSSGRNATEVSAIWGPPEIAWPIVRFQPTVTREMVGSLNIAGFPINLEETELVTTQKHFGGEIGNRGDAGDALGWLCLYRRDQGTSWVLWLESSEIDGPTIGGFRWQKLDPNSKMDKRCQSLEESNASFSLPLALRLGMKEAEVRSTLGQPSARSGEMAIYEHEHNVTIGSEPYEVSNIVIITYHCGRVWAINVTHSTVS